MKKMFIGLLVTLALSACDNSNNNSYIVLAEQQVPPDAIQGFWYSSCYMLTDADSGNFISYAADFYTFNVTSYRLEVFSFDDQSCSTRNDNSDIYTGTYQVGETLINSSNENVTKIQFEERAINWPENIPSINKQLIFIFDNYNGLHFGKDTGNSKATINYNILYRSVVN